MKKVIQYYRSDVDAAIFNLQSKLKEELESGEDYVFLTLLEGGSFLSSRLLDGLLSDELEQLSTFSMKVSSYHGQEQGEISLDYIPNVDFKDKNVIVVDDFCDSGKTIKAVTKLLQSRGAKKIIFFTLLARKGFTVPESITLYYGILDSTKNFYIGCGLDDNDKCRFVDYIYYYSDDKEK